MKNNITRIHTAEDGSEAAREAQLFDLVPAVIEEELVQTVSARTLHAFLDVKKVFSEWMKDQIERARLIERRDFIVREGGFLPEGKKPANGRPPKEYFLTLDSAKHVAMMSGTDKGFEVRDYFIECERRTRASAPRTRVELIRSWLEAEEARELERIEKEAAKAELADVIDNNTLFPHPEWTNGVGIAVTRIKSTYVPYMAIPDIGTVLHYVGHPLTKFRLRYASEESVNGNLDMWVEEGLEDSFAQFREEANETVNASRDGVTIRHPCLGKKVIRVRRELAVLFLGYGEDSFS
jgi:phage anti-repressor protein